MQPTKHWFPMKTVTKICKTSEGFRPMEVYEIQYPSENPLGSLALKQIGTPRNWQLSTAAKKSWSKYSKL